MNFTINGKTYKITKAYNGKTGCMCGCRGNYVETEGRAMKQRVTKVAAFIGPMRPESNDANAYSVRGFMGEGYIATVEGDRQTVVYFQVD